MDDEYDPRLDDLDDGREYCPECGAPMTLDFDGDPDVIGGTRDFWICEECPGKEVAGDG